jgi:hypothetical protein
MPLLCTRTAGAVEGIEIASAFDEDDPFDLFVGVRYLFEARRAAIKRELSGTVLEDTPPGAVPIVRDLVFHEDRHVITPHAAIGVFRDLQLSFALPIVVNLTREYEFDQRADPCVFPGSSQPATCIDRTNSSTLIDKLLPDGANGSIGYDAGDPTTGFDLDSTTLFRSVGRSGLDQVHLGVSWAPMNQERDDTKPTWVLSAELRYSVGKIMKWDRLDPGSQTGVSRGVHEVRLSTGVSKRTRWAEPFVFFWWLAPIGVRGDNARDPDSSLFWDVGFGQRSARPQQSAGTLFGFEAIVYDKPGSGERLNLELAGRLEAKFNGLGYSEMWEPFAFAGDVHDNPTGPLVVDLDPTSPQDTPVSHPGVSLIENYMSFGARAGLNAQLGKNVKFGASFEIGRDQTHTITYTDAGRELPACGMGAAPPSCEVPDDDVVTPDTVEVDPLHKQIIDVTGRRYLVDETTVLTVLVNGTIVF